MLEEKLPYFDNSLLPEPKNEFVAWVDIMGISTWASFSYKVPITFMLKFQLKIYQITQEFNTIEKKTLFYYPFNDGFFLTSEDDGIISETLCKLFKACAEEFLKQLETKSPAYVFIPRGAIAYGKVTHGNDISDSVFSVKEIKQNMIFGDAVVMANHAERESCPFGMLIHISCLEIITQKYEASFFEYLSCFDTSLASELEKKFNEYWILRFSHMPKVECAQFEDEQAKRERDCAKFNAMIREMISI